MNPEVAVSTQFIIFWAGWALVILAAGVWVFLWSVRTGQYSEERRSGMIPLDDVPLEDLDRRAAETRREGRGHFGFILIIVGIGVAMVMLSVVSSLMAPGDDQQGPATAADTALHEGN
ncbi:cbb3-type cytochrome oxidase assembly protein [Candidatus Sumerlaeota bacterium]|nr:cbb3-type cytochrome oxidase assembly protein [Candidatus Sumerlaeota bacterium]